MIMMMMYPHAQISYWSDFIDARVSYVAPLNSTNNVLLLPIVLFRIASFEVFMIRFLVFILDNIYHRHFWRVLYVGCCCRLIRALGKHVLLQQRTLLIGVRVQSSEERLAAFCFTGTDLIWLVDLI